MCCQKEWVVLFQNSAREFSSAYLVKAVSEQRMQRFHQQKLRGWT